MVADTSTDVKKAEMKETDKLEKGNGAESKSSSDTYVLPVVGVKVPSQVVDLGFWGGLVGAAALGIVDPPLALFVGAGVVIARHRAKK